MSGSPIPREFPIREPTATELFEILVREHEARLRGFIASLVRDPGTIEDLVQESFLVAWRNLSRYDRNLPFGPWVRGIARRLCLAYYRRPERLDFIDEETVSQLSRLHDSLERMPGSTLDDQLASLRVCLERLPSHQQRVLHLHYEENLGCSEIAETIGRSREAVKKVLQRSRAWLARCIQERMAALGIES
ncbi:MAG: RNA polymerase sigma factor [Planctomycetota bacterium]